MNTLWIRLWKDDRAAVSALSTLLIYTILILGVTVGLVALRDQLVHEYDDLSDALEHLDQSWQVNELGFDDVPPPDPEDDPCNVRIDVPPVSESGSN